MADEASSTLTCALHVHTTVSTGVFEPATILEMARQAGLDAVLFTDSAERRWEYGLWPARGILRWVVEQPSVSTFTPRRYLERIESLNTGTGVLAIAGVEAAPFYFWRRPPVDRQGGALWGWQRHLLIFLDDAESIRRLPLRSVDPYHGDQGAAPYQQLIDYVVQRGGLVFWAHPEVVHQGRHGLIEDYTEPYLHLLEQTSGYHGFALTYWGYLSAVEPGQVWDRLLTDYCRGRRLQPAWIVGELDWRNQERSLTAVTTRVVASSRSRGAVLEALRHGRMWVVVRAGKDAAPTMTQFAVTDESTGQVVGVGQRLRPTGRVLVRVVGRRGSGQDPLRVTLVAGGRVWVTQEVVDTAFDLQWSLDDAATLGYCRVIIQDTSGGVYTNPVFFR